MATTKILTSHDTSVLSTLFDPEASLSAQPAIDPTSKLLPQTPSYLLSTLQRRETAIISTINVEEPSNDALRQAVQALEDLIQEHPKYASAWNNKAQAGRIILERKTDLVGDAVAIRTQKNIIISDLSEAIRLASPQKSADRVSALQAKILASAYTQRGLLYWKAAKTRSEGSDKDEGDVDRRAVNESAAIPELSKEQLEKLASRDFAMGGRYGNETAKKMAVAANPYAKLCGNIVQQAMREEKGRMEQSITVFTPDE